MDRRYFLKSAAIISSLPLLGSRIFAASRAVERGRVRSRVRPGDSGWPSKREWRQLKQDVGGRLIKLHSPFDVCANGVNAACRSLLKAIQNPFYIGSEPALTQSSGWVDAWRCRPSAYAVAAERTSDVVAAVNFARKHHLRLVVKGGGHSYQGACSAPDSLLVWTRRMKDIELHDGFVGKGCTARQSPRPAVTIGAGAMWIDAYNAVTTETGRYVQGGGCTTVGVAGLVQSGGFGSFSKRYGTAAAGLLEAEIVTADGQTRIANACTNPDLFWGIKGGGGGSLGVVTRLTLQTRDLPNHFGGVFGTIKASSNTAYRRLIEQVVRFYREALFNPHWGEQITCRSDNAIELGMVFQGLDQRQAKQVWKPLIDWIKRSKGEYSFEEPFIVAAIPARHFWDVSFYEKRAPQLVYKDNRPDAPKRYFAWAGDVEQAGELWHAYKSTWLPAALLQKDQQPRLVEALFTTARQWGVALHVNKGLAGAPAEAISAARNTATNPAAVDAFALAMTGARGPAAYPGMPGAQPDPGAARKDAAMIDEAWDNILKIAPDAGSYVSESDFFLKNWQNAYWGSNYPRLAGIKAKYDPHGLFFVHHGVGSEQWSDDGFTRLNSS